MKTMELSNVTRGNTFRIGDMDFIKITDMNGGTFITTKGAVFRSAFGENNNLSESKVLQCLKEDFLPKIVKQIGEKNILEFETDLTTLDGLKPYPVMKSKISLPTFDFYRQNVDVFDKYKLDEGWWLATPEGADPHAKNRWVVCVAPSGYIYYNNCYDNGIGVRPVLYFVSSISVSCKD